MVGLSDWVVRSDKDLVAPVLAHRLAGGGEPPIVEEAPLYFEDFSGATGGVEYPVIDPPYSWDILTSGAIVNNAKLDPVAKDGILTRRAAGFVGEFTEPGSVILSPPVDPGLDYYYEVELAPGASSFTISFAATNEKNRGVLSGSGWSLIRYASGAAAYEAAHRTVVAASNHAGTTATGRFPNARTAAAGSRMRVDYYGGTGRAYLSHNGCPLGSAAGYDMGGLTGRPGIATLNNTHRHFTSVEIAPLAGRITFGALERVYPRIQGLGGYEHGAADVPMPFTYEGTPTGIQWALYDPETGALVKDWARVPSADLTLNAGVGNATLRVPCGLNGRLPYRIALRFEGNTKTSRQGGFFYVAYTILGHGQSNMAFMANNYSGAPGVVDHPGGICANPADPPSLVKPARSVTSTWESSTVEGSVLDTCLGMLTGGLSAALNLPVYVIMVAIPANGSGNMAPLTGLHANYLQTHIAQCGGAFDAIIYSQGENEISVGGATNWKSNTTNTLAECRTLSGQPSGTIIPIFLAITGRHDVANDPAEDVNAEIVRRQQIEIASEVDDLHIAYHHVGAPMLDTFHIVYTATGYPELARRLMLSMRKVLAGGAYDGRGPRASGATRAGDDLIIAIDKNGADSIAGAALTSYQASLDNFATTLALNGAVNVVGDTIVIPLAAGQPGLPKVRNHYGHNPDVSSWVIGTYADATTIPMEPVAVALVTAS